MHSGYCNPKNTSNLYLPPPLGKEGRAEGYNPDIASLRLMRESVINVSGNTYLGAR